MQMALLEALEVAAALVQVVVLVALEILRQQVHLRVIMVETGHLLGPDIQGVVAVVLVQ
jgi:hypothetical protein